MNKLKIIFGDDFPAKRGGGGGGRGYGTILLGPIFLELNFQGGEIFSRTELRHLHTTKRELFLTFSKGFI